MLILCRQTDIKCTYSSADGSRAEILKGLLNGSVVKNLPMMQEPQETWVWSLGREDPLEEEMAIHSSILAWKIPWREEPGGL